MAFSTPRPSLAGPWRNIQTIRASSFVSRQAFSLLTILFRVYTSLWKDSWWCPSSATTSRFMTASLPSWEVSVVSRRNSWLHLLPKAGTCTSGCWCPGWGRERWDLNILIGFSSLSAEVEVLPPPQYCPSVCPSPSWGRYSLYLKPCPRWCGWQWVTPALRSVFVFNYNSVKTRMVTLAL